VSINKVHFAVTGLWLVGSELFVVSQHRAQIALREQNETLRQGLAQLASGNASLSNRLERTGAMPAPRLPAPPLQGVTAARSAEEASTTNLIAYMVHGGEAPRTTAAQLKRYLDDNHRSPDSLLSAYRTSHDASLLQEAMAKYAGNPQVAFEALMNKDGSPTERREWLEAFKRAAPENPLANYLSALDYFRSGQSDQAVQELIAAGGRPGFADYTVERIQTDAEAYRAAGYSEADARMAADRKSTRLNSSHRL